MTDLTPAVNQLLTGTHSAPKILDSDALKSTTQTVDEFLKEAYRINSHITSLLQYLQSIRQSYLSTATSSSSTTTTSSSHGPSSNPRQHQRHASSRTNPQTKYLTDQERDSIDSSTALLLRDLSSSIANLSSAESLRQETETSLLRKKYGNSLANNPIWRWAAGNDSSTGDGGGGVASARSPEQELDEEKARMVRMVRENVLWFLRRGLEGAAEVQRGMVEKRIEREREKEKSVLYKVAGGASMASSVGSLGGNGNAGGGGSGGVEGGRGYDVTSGDGGMADVESQLSPEQLQLFAEENDSMLKHYEDTLNKVQNAEKSLLEISSLQQTLVTHLSTQEDYIGQLVTDVTTTHTNVGQGNKELKRAAERRSTAQMVFWGTDLNMASDSVHAAEINLKELTVKTVTLGPERATVVGEILDVPIKPGPNEITIHGLDPGVDLDSIRVTGRGAATITDIQTELVPQREYFEDVYPSDSDGDELIEDEDPDDNFGVDRSELDRVEGELKVLRDRMATARNDQNTANTSLELLDSYGRTMKAGEVDVGKMADYLQVYQKERARLSDLYQESESTIKETEKEVDRFTREWNRLSLAFLKARDDAAKPARQDRERKQNALDLKRRERSRVRQERRKFWPHRVANVVLHLDGISDFTPGSSRRSSVVSTKKPDLTAHGSDTVSLSLNYVTTKATWSPRYELNLETPTASGKIVYRAEYHNYSSETWKDTRLILSTSQTSFSGIEEKTPDLQPWNVKLLVDDANEKKAGNAASWQGGLENRAEVAARSRPPLWKPIDAGPGRYQRPYQQQQQQQPVFGHQQMPQQMMQQQAMRVHTDSIQKPNATNSGGLFGSAAPNTQNAAPGGFGSSAARGGSSLFGAGPSNPDNAQNTQNLANQDYQMQLMLLEQQNKRRLLMARQEHDGPRNATDDDYNSDDEWRNYPDSDGVDAETLSAPNNANDQELTYQETSRQDYGLTTTYDIPGTRTIRPSSLKRRHVIAELPLSTIRFSHLIIPKLRPAAFLRARITNTSSISLLRGKAGLTLDGTFLGTTTIPTCSPDAIFSLSLGVDPGIQVSYAKPTVRRATSGFFNKEDCAIFTRVCRITNTKTTAVSLAVMDQVPVSEDERLRVGILEPKGLNKEGELVNVGAEVGTIAAATYGGANTSSSTSPAKGGKSSDRSWGKGTVVLGKGGNITWQLTLEKGKAVKLTLEYEARIPSGQKIVGLD
ncbi:hypothetical protein FQN54_002885 [Arachnomyces sp. PD_36]|nr:hypothetical protein FQN54_002885 [Arachnomyces sp. PD_36]